MATRDPVAAQKVADALVRWAQSSREEKPTPASQLSWAEYATEWLVEPVSRLVLSLISFELGLGLDDGEFRTCQRLCRGAFLSIGIQLRLGSAGGRKEAGPAVVGGAEQPSPSRLAAAVMSLFRVDHGRAVAFCEGQVLQGAEEYCALLRVAAGRPDASSRAVLLHIDRLRCYFPADSLAAGLISNTPATSLGDCGVQNGNHSDGKTTQLKRNLNGTNGTGGNSGQANESLQRHYYSVREETISTLISIRNTSPSLEPVAAPFDYVCSLKSKGVRNKLIAALNAWIPLPPADLESVMSAVADVHNTSLMLDDVQDDSPLRRSSPATHTIFGMPQTVNSAVYQTVNTIERVSASGNLRMVDELVSGMKTLLIGQGLDLLWTWEVSTPSLEEYLQMVDSKTGALFLMIHRLMAAASSGTAVEPALDRLMLLLGRYFQIRDDYANLASPDYSKSKGFCEDLDEGKCSFMMLHAMRNAEPRSRTILKNMLLQRHKAGRAGVGHKEAILAILEEAGSLEFTIEMLREMEVALIAELESVERITGVQNPMLRGILMALKM
ncbi:terpenoid synthase [Colletotrichum zoysiae]|uniref:Terpenoid synthase n=1 Tax=Colletotrichum zoysiae TaxID=1216348 RepID=A0AAD9M057_9PEZI|nr:terpenoid synthase [Colletotrichum zoysiae]